MWTCSKVCKATTRAPGHPAYRQFPDAEVFGCACALTVADVDGAPAEGEVVLAAVDVGLVPVGVEGHRARLRRKVEQTLQGTNSEIDAC